MGQKRCTKCEGVKPYSEFCKNKNSKDGMQHTCKSCARAYYQTPESKERLRKYRQRNDVKANDIERRKEYNQRPEIKIKNRERTRVLQQTDYNKNYRKRYFQRDDLRLHRNSICLVNTKKYQARIRELPKTLSATEWQHALNYFNGYCAACGRTSIDSGGSHKISIDHWIPLSYKGDDNPGTVAANIVPLCHGWNGCNNRKYNTMPDEWLEREFGKRKAKKIAARIQSYFDSLG